MNDRVLTDTAADGKSTPSEFTTRGFFSFSGRIGRMEFFWTQILSLSAVIFAGNGVAWLIERNNLWPAFLIALPVTFLAVYIGFAAGIKRCHDLGRSGGWYLLSAIPVVNIAFGFYLLFSSGEDRRNQYGQPLGPRSATPPTSAAYLARAISDAESVGHAERDVSTAPVSPPYSPTAQQVKPIPNARNAPPEDLWAAALTEFDSAARRAGLWARVFADAQGNEGVAKANYLRHRADELMQENEALFQQKQHNAKAAEVAALLVNHSAERRAYALLPKGVCPNCKAAVLPLTAKRCTKCQAILDSHDGWRVIPIDENQELAVLEAAFSTGIKLTIDEVIFLTGRSKTNSSILEMQDEHCDTLLHKAAALGLQDEVKTLIANGADAGASNLQGQKPFALAKDLGVQRLLREAVGAAGAQATL